MTMERSLLPLPQKKKSLGKNSPSNVASDKSKAAKNILKLETSKKNLSPVELNKSTLCTSNKNGKNTPKESSTSSNFGSKQKVPSLQVQEVSTCKRMSNVTNLETSTREHYESPKIFIRDGNDLGSNLSFVLSRGQCGALSCSNKRMPESKHPSLRNFSKHLPQFAKDVLNSKGCTSKVQPTYQKLDKLRFGDDLMAEELSVVEESGSPIYHELDPIGIQCSKHTYQSIGEIQEELSKMGSTPSIPEPRSAPPVNFPVGNTPTSPQNASHLAAPTKIKSSPKSFFSKMWQPRKNQKSNQKECKFINSMPLLLPKDSPDYTPDETQQSPSLITFHGGARSQMGSISQPGSANLEKSGYASSPHTCRVFTFEDIEINDAQFSQAHEINKQEKKSPPLPLSKDFKLKSGLAKQRVSPLAFDSPKSETFSNIGCYATLMFTENSLLGGVPTLQKKNSKQLKCFEPHSKALHSAIVPPRLLSNQSKVLAYGKSSLIKEPHAHADRKPLCKTQKMSKNNIPNDICTNDSSDLNTCTNTSGSIESLLSQDTLRSDSPVFHHSPLHRSPYSSPSCGVRMAEIRANSRRSDSKSPSPEPPLGSITNFPYHHKDTHYTRLDGTGQTTHLIKSPPKVVCKSPNRYMHTILEEEHSVEHILCIESLEEFSTSVSLSDQPAVILENRVTSSTEQAEICEDRLKTFSYSDMKGLRSSSLSSDLASVPSDFLSSEDSISCHTTDSEMSFKNENESGLLRRDQYYIKLPNANKMGKTNSNDQAQSYDKVDQHQILQSREKFEEALANASDKLTKSSKLRPPKSSFCVSVHDSSVDKTSCTFQTGSSKSSINDSTQSNGSTSSSNRAQLSQVTADGRRSFLAGPTSCFKQTSLKYSRRPSSPSPLAALQRQQSDLVAVEVKTPSIPSQNDQGSRILRPPKTSKSHFGYMKHQRNQNDSPHNSSTSRNCQTIPAPTRGTSSGFDSSLPKSETTIIHQGPRHRPSTASCDLNSSLSSSPTSSSSSMFSTVESENENLLLALRKDLMPGDGRFKVSKEASNQSLDSRTTSSLNSNSESESSRDRSRLVAPRTDVSRCLEMYTKILSTAQDSYLRATPSSKQLKTSTVPTDC